MGSVMARAQVLAQTLSSPRWDVISLIRTRAKVADAKAAAIIDAMTAALGDDEHVTSLDQQLDAQHRAALHLLEQPVQVPEPTVAKPPAPVERTPEAGVRQIQRRSAKASAVREALREVEEALAADPELCADIDCRVYRASSKEGSVA